MLLSCYWRHAEKALVDRKLFGDLSERGYFITLFLSLKRALQELFYFLSSIAK